MKIKKGSVAIYVLAMMLVTAGYWNYISHESQTIETVSMSQSNQESKDERDEHLGDATLVSNNELIKEENFINKQKSKELVQQILKRSIYGFKILNKVRYINKRVTISNNKFL